MNLDDASERAAGIARLLAAIEAAVNERRPARSDWHDAVEEATKTLAIALDRVQHPDDYSRFAELVGHLAGIWFDVDEEDAIYLDGRQP